MYTTSRYSSKKTRKLAGCEAKTRDERYIARGKKTIDSLAQEARRMGEETLHIIEERKGEAALVATIMIDAAGKWRWAGEEPFAPLAKDKAKSGKRGTV
jgi:hypothetical protein